MISQNHLLNETIKDSPWATTFILYLLGVNLEQWVVVLGLLYGVVRLGMAIMEGYWKIKDRRNGSIRSKTE